MTQEQKEQLAREYSQRDPWVWNDDGEGKTDISQEIYDTCIAMLNARDEEVDKLKEQHEDDRLWLDSANANIKFYSAFIDYLADKAIGDKAQIIDAIANNDYNRLIGYVKVTKTLNNAQDLILEFEADGNKYKAEWQPSENCACWQTCGMMGDDYSGYLLFPTYKDDEYFCIAYTC